VALFCVLLISAFYLKPSQQSLILLDAKAMLTCDMFIRPVTQRDHAKIPHLVEAAFGRHDEGLLVDQLRRNDDIAVEYVATDRDELVGHIVFSCMIAPVGCLALAPLSVHPDRQKTGIGSTLIRIATEAVEEQDWIAAFVLGNPSYYSRFGYDVELAQGFDTPYPPEFTAARVFDEATYRSLPRELVYPPAF
jgi:putative acetyltransferase